MEIKNQASGMLATPPMVRRTVCIFNQLNPFAMQQLAPLKRMQPVATTKTNPNSGEITIEFPVSQMFTIACKNGTSANMTKTNPAAISKSRR